VTVGHNTANIRNTLADAVDTAIGNAGLLRFYTASYATTLCTITLGSPPFGNASSGTITLQGVPLEGTCVAGGTVAKFRLLTSAGAEIVNGDVGTSGADINLSSTTVSTNDVIRITGLTYSAPA